MIWIFLSSALWERTIFFFSLSRERRQLEIESKNGLPLISNHSIQPLFKSNQFFFELSKLTSLNEGRKRDLNEKLFTARVALWNSDPNTKNPIGVALSKRDPCCKKFHMGRPLKERPIWVILKKKIQKSENIISKGDPYYLYYNIL